MVEKPPTRQIACQIKFLSSFWLCQPLLPPHHKVFHPYRFGFFTTRFGFSAAISTANIVKRTGLSSRRKNYRFCGERPWYVLVSACTCYKKWSRDTTRIKSINKKKRYFFSWCFCYFTLVPKVLSAFNPPQLWKPRIPWYQAGRFLHPLLYSVNNARVN